MRPFLLRSGEATQVLTGRLAVDLARIANAGIAIAPTVVVPSSAFSDYLAGRWDDRLIFRTLELLQTESSLVVRASLTYDSVWCETGLHAGNSSVDLRNAIERIYRSFTTPRSRACRIACGWPEDEFNPTVVVQSDLPTVGRLLSRHAVTGRIVDADNWDDNVNNEMTVHDLDTYISLCHSAETALGSPVLTSFVESPGPSISDIEPPLMTDSALLTALLDLYQKGVLSSMSLLRRVQPSMFGYFTGRYKLDRTKRIGLISAIPAAPGQVIGIVRLRGFSRAELGNRTGRAPLPAVLVLDEATPDDVLDMTQLPQRSAA